MTELRKTADHKKSWGKLFKPVPILKATMGGEKKGIES
jgi:hypothetical protein